MAIAIPKTRPQLPAADVMKIVKHFNVDMVKYPVVVVGIRGYYEDSIGKKDENDRGVYDDAMFVVGLNGLVEPYNANTDPATYRKGYGIGESKGMASLKANQVYYAWKLDFHKGKYPALCQRLGPMTVIRDGINGNYEQTSEWLGINGHKGGINTTASLGCQTVPPQQWDDFYATVELNMIKYFGSTFKKVVIPYVFVDETYRRAI